MRTAGRAALPTPDKKYGCHHLDCQTTGGRPVPLTANLHRWRLSGVLQDSWLRPPRLRHNRNLGASSHYSGRQSTMSARASTPPDGRPLPRAVPRRAGFTYDAVRLPNVRRRLAGSTLSRRFPPSTRRSPLPEFRRAIPPGRTPHDGRLRLGEDGRSRDAQRRPDPPARTDLRSEPLPAASLLGALPGRRSGALCRRRPGRPTRPTTDPRGSLPRFDLSAALSVLPARRRASLQLPLDSTAGQDRARSQLKAAARIVGPARIQDPLCGGCE